jgi:hypothetical protein
VLGGRRQVGISNSCAGEKSIPGEWDLARNRLVGNRRRLVYSRIEARHQVLDAPSLHYRITRSILEYIMDLDSRTQISFQSPGLHDLSVTL